MFVGKSISSALLGYGKHHHQQAGVPGDLACLSTRLRMVAASVDSSGEGAVIPKFTSEGVLLTQNSSYDKLVTEEFT